MADALTRNSRSHRSPALLTASGFGPWPNPTASAYSRAMGIVTSFCLISFSEWWGFSPPNAAARKLKYARANRVHHVWTSGGTSIINKTLDLICLLSQEATTFWARSRQRRSKWQRTMSSTFLSEGHLLFFFQFCLAKTTKEDALHFTTPSNVTWQKHFALATTCGVLLPSHYVQVQLKKTSFIHLYFHSFFFSSFRDN